MRPYLFVTIALLLAGCSQPLSLSPLPPSIQVARTQCFRNGICVTYDPSTIDHVSVNNTEEIPTNTTASCDPSLWNHVYHPSRLTILNPCMVVTGIIKKTKQESDGDTHIQLQLDQPYQNLLNAKNLADQDGNLVLEPVCQNPVTQQDAMEACKNYQQNIWIPNVGAHVQVTGAYVLDTDHGWNELHPVTSIQVIQ